MKQSILIDTAIKFIFKNLVAFALIVSIANCEKKEEVSVELAIVNTGEVTNITAYEAELSNTVELNGGAEITARGVCWSTLPDPVVADNITSDGTGDGMFASIISGLMPNTTYFVRAYATNSRGTAYGETKQFKTQDDAAPLAIASFTYITSETNFLEVTFTNNSQNDVSWAWHFGDNESQDNTSTLENPKHKFSAEGNFNVSLIVKNADEKVSRAFIESINISDPVKEQKLLTGDVSKDWKLYREGIALEIGPSAANPTGWFALENNGSRPCSYEDKWTFHYNGTMEFDDAKSFWGELGIWGTNANENPLYETCFVPTLSNMTINGTDVSAWGSGSFMFEYLVADGELILNGEGAWMVVPNLGTDANHALAAFPSSKTVPITIEEFDGYDLLTVTFDHGDAGAGGQGFRRATYVSYDDWNEEPALVTEVPACAPHTAVSPSIISHSFASNETDQWNLMQPIESNSGLNLGVNDPTDAAATKVGEFIRTVDLYQDLQFKIAPVADNTPINFENLTTITMDVYIPSSNDYTAGLNKNVFVGFGATNCPPNWFMDNTEYRASDVTLDSWTTLTFSITSPDYVAIPDNGANPRLRNDFDMIYISIGGNNHTSTGSFYIRNFKIQ